MYERFISISDSNCPMWPYPQFVPGEKLGNGSQLEEGGGGGGGGGVMGPYDPPPPPPPPFWIRHCDTILCTCKYSRSQSERKREALGVSLTFTSSPCTTSLNCCMHAGGYSAMFTPFNPGCNSGECEVVKS